MYYYVYQSLLTVKRAKNKAQATYQWDILIRVDQLTSCTRGGEGGRLSGHCGRGFGHSAARGVRRRSGRRRDRGLGVGGECCFGRVGGGGCTVGVRSCSSWSAMLGLCKDTIQVTANWYFLTLRYKTKSQNTQRIKPFWPSCNKTLKVTLLLMIWSLWI